jgi:O-antigen/teichoic acid export membrane protein
LILFLYLYKSVWSIFVVLSISLFLAAIYCFIILLKKYHFFFKGKVEPVDSKRLLFFSGFLAINSLNALVFANIDRLMLGYYVDAKFIGFYTAIFTVISGMLALLSFGGVVFPAFVSLDKEKLKRAFQKTFHYLFLIALPATVGLSFIFIPLMKILYGASYVPPQNQLTLTITSILLTFLILEGTLTALYTILFNAKEKPKWPALIMLLAAILNVVLNFIFITTLIKIKPEYGLIGAALATFISRYFNLIFLSIMAKKKLGISPKGSFFLRVILSTFIMLIFLSVYTFFIKLNILSGIVLIVLAAIIYLLFLALFKGIPRSDFKEFFSGRVTEKNHL